MEPTVYVNFSIDIVIAQKKRVDKRWKQLTTQKKTINEGLGMHLLPTTKLQQGEDTSVA